MSIASLNISSSGDDYWNELHDDWIRNASIATGYTMIVASAISIFACLLVLYAVASLPNLWTKGYFQVQVFITFSDLLSACGGIIGNARNKSEACYWQGVATNLFPGTYKGAV